MNNNQAFEDFLSRNFTRDELREIAKDHEIKAGRNKIDTIRNIIPHESEINFFGYREYFNECKRI